MDDQTRNIECFRFVWDEKLKSHPEFENLVKNFSASFKVEQTGEILNFDINNMNKIIKLKNPIKVNKNIEHFKPFGDNRNAKFYILDRTVDSGYYFCVTVILNNFFKQEGNIATVAIGFQGPSFVVYSYDYTQ